MILKVTFPLGHITYLIQIDDTRKTLIYKKLSSSHTSLNASLIICIIFVLFQGKYKERITSLWLIMQHFHEKEANEFKRTLCVNISHDKHALSIATSQDSIYTKWRSWLCWF